MTSEYDLLMPEIAFCQIRRDMSECVVCLCSNVFAYLRDKNTICEIANGFSFNLGAFPNIELA